MPILSRQHRYLFLMAPRTGCTAIGEGVLIPHAAGEYFPAENVPYGKGKCAYRKHATLGEVLAAGLLTRAEADDLLVFTTVRNPFDSLVTLYITMQRRYAKQLDDPQAFLHDRPHFIAQTKAALELDFPAWAKGLLGPGSWRHPYSRVRYGLLPPHHMYAGYLDGADVILRFESLQADFDALCARLGLPALEIPWQNVSRSSEERDYHTYYDDATRAAVERVYRPDLERFGYAF